MFFLKVKVIYPIVTTDNMGLKFATLRCVNVVGNFNYSIGRDVKKCFKLLLTIKYEVIEKRKFFTT